MHDRSHLCYKSIIHYDLDLTNTLVVSPQVRYIKAFDVMNPRFNEQFWPVPSDFVKSRFHCTLRTFQQKPNFLLEGQPLQYMFGDTKGSLIRSRTALILNRSFICCSCKAQRTSLYANCRFWPSREMDPNKVLGCKTFSAD